MKKEGLLKIDAVLLVNYAYGFLAPGISQSVEAALQSNGMLRTEYEGILHLMKDHPDEDPDELLLYMSEAVLKNIQKAFSADERRTANASE